ncbi:LysR family transcriptional regulator [Pigmentiphaga sp. H8]|uniref:LysR family transcriptional regulator n=1 Tax=Pigmentiphaga sp. H8 TaxID=2488560 RepID=UPI000F59BCFE|nr:LysR family transcriptional regulator [Pigmentiphaga sp. H8]AZG10965.1 LysR family transcriptional regulator [Pigmentiphaga sp. H8]
MSSLHPLLNRVRLTHLRLLVAIADSGSLLAAAQLLHMSQPAATKALKQMEAGLGETLVTRTATGSALTPVGHLLCHRARQVLAELRDAEHDIELFHEGHVGQVIVGSLPVATTSLVPQAVSRLNQDHPGIALRVFEGSSESLFPRLMQGDLDVLIGRFWLGEQSGLVNEPLFDSEFRIAAGAHHPLAAHAGLTLDDLLTYPWILPPPSDHFRVAIDDFFRYRRVRPPAHIVETTAYGVVRGLLRTTNMVVLLPEVTLRDDVRDGFIRWLPLNLELRLPPVGIVRVAQRPVAPAVQTWLRYVRQSAADLLTPPAPGAPL